MKYIQRDAGAFAQGDTIICAVDTIPDTAKEAAHAIFAHSETGHHHIAEPAEQAMVKLFTTENPMVCYLRAEGFTDLVHHRSFDTHETIRIPPGDYMIRRQREGSPEGWRMVMD